MIFAAKTTASGLIALLTAFTFNFDQPQWALLTVFIVAQPQSGLVLGKSFYRIIGTLIGAAVALLFVALFAQERVLFLGALALWIGLCTFGSQYARNFTAYSFVLAGYTVAIVGIPGALDAGNAFYIATARVTEISLGIIVTATVSQVVFPSSMAPALWQSVADIRVSLANYVSAILGSRDVAQARADLMSRAIAIETLRASAIFEDREVRSRSRTLRHLNAMLIDVLGAAQLLDERLKKLRHANEWIENANADALAEIADTVTAWGTGKIDAAASKQKLLSACAHLPPWVFPDFFAALIAYVDAYESYASGSERVPQGTGFTHANERVVALWTGLRASLAVFFVSSFWILSDWPHGSTAVILAAVATARLATMGHAVPIAFAATFIFTLATIPAFVVIEMLLPLASGFEMFALIVAPGIFCCALLMAHEKTKLIGFFSGLLFASVGLFQNRMVYDPIGLLNTSIAAVFAAGSALVMWAILAPETPEAAYRRFLRIARRALARLNAQRQVGGLPEFEMTMTEALDQLRGHLRCDRADEVAAFDAAIELLGAGRQLISLRKKCASDRAGNPEPRGSDLDEKAKFLEQRFAQLSAERKLGGLRDAA
jgi:uncharacterized membrane protein YccC